MYSIDTDTENSPLRTDDMERAATQLRPMSTKVPSSDSGLESVDGVIDAAGRPDIHMASHE